MTDRDGVVGLARRDGLERRRELLGISHVVVRELESFAPVVAALAGR
jgi:hypothetical protein